MNRTTRDESRETGMRDRESYYRVVYIHDRGTRTDNWNGRFAYANRNIFSNLV